MGQEDKSIGWIRLYRKLQECWIWDDKPFSYGQAWVDLLLLVNHRDKQILFDGQVITVGKGQRVTSIRQLADRWGWSRTKVARVLDLLEKDKMIERKSDNKKTLITIVNYEVYQYPDATEKPQKSHRRDTDVPQADTNNNEKNEIKNDKEKKLSSERKIIPPTVEMVQAYCDERGNGISGEQFVDFYQSKNWFVGKSKMSDWQAAIRTWEQKRGFKYDKPEKKEEPPKKDPNEGLDKYDPDNPMDTIIHDYDEGWRINDDGYWIKQL